MRTSETPSLLFSFVSGLGTKAQLPHMQLRVEVGKVALHTVRGRSNLWPHDCADGLSLFM